MHDLTNKRFGKLIALRISKRKKTKSGTKVYWLCKCDCGKETEVVTYHLTAGLTISCGCAYKDFADKHRGPLHQNWKGGRTISSDGYILLYNPEHPNASKSGYVLEHVFMMSQKLGRALSKNETVHHKNGIHSDNRDDNFELWSSSHPSGQRVIDKVQWCVEFLSMYAPSYLRKGRIVRALPLKIEV